jgi:hypothetical protein
LFVDLGYQGPVQPGTVDAYAVDARNLEHCLPAASPPAAVSEVLELAEQGNGFPVRLVGDFLEPPVQFVGPLVLRPVPFEQLSFGFGNALGAALLHFDS